MTDKVSPSPPNGCVSWTWFPCCVRIGVLQPLHASPLPQWLPLQQGDSLENMEGNQCAGLASRFCDGLWRRLSEFFPPVIVQLSGQYNWVLLHIASLSHTGMWGQCSLLWCEETIMSHFHHITVLFSIHISHFVPIYSHGLLSTTLAVFSRHDWFIYLIIQDFNTFETKYNLQSILF